MYKSILSFLFLAFFSMQAFAQGARIELDVAHYTSDTIILGYYLADKMLVLDTVVKKSEEPTFVYEQDTLMPAGMYIVVSQPEGLFYQVMVSETDQNFRMSIDTTSQEEVKFQGSEENAIFYDYLNFVSAARVESARLDRVIAGTDSVMMSVRDQLMKDKLEIDYLVKEKQGKVIAEHPESIAAMMIKANLPITFPEYTGSPQEVQMQKYRFYKKRYFDNVDLLHPAMLRSPIINERINYYVENLTPIEPDSIIQSVDYILGKLAPNQEAYRYYLSHFLNKYGNSKYIGMDAIYVHLALNYYGKDKAPWISEENKKEIVDNAKKIEPVLIGKPAPDFTIQKEDGTPVSLSDFDREFLVMIFWKPNCGHCTEAMPHVIDFAEKWKDNVDVLSICTKMGKDYGSCWSDVVKKKMDQSHIINAGDEFGKSRILAKYYATSTPKIFIINKEKKIQLKKIPAENLDAVMEQIMKNKTTITGE